MRTYTIYFYFRNAADMALGANGQELFRHTGQSKSANSPLIDAYAAYVYNGNDLSCINHIVIDIE